MIYLIPTDFYDRAVLNARFFFKQKSAEMGHFEGAFPSESLCDG